MLGNIDILKETLANNEMGLVSSFSFKKLFGMLAGPNAFLVYSELIIQLTSSLSVVENVTLSSTASERWFEKWKFGEINFALIYLAIVVKWLLNSLAVIAGSVMSLPFTWMEVILFFWFFW